MSLSLSRCLVISPNALEVLSAFPWPWGHSGMVGRNQTEHRHLHRYPGSVTFEQVTSLKFFMCKLCTTLPGSCDLTGSVEKLGAEVLCIHCKDSREGAFPVLASRRFSYAVWSWVCPWKQQIVPCWLFKCLPRSTCKLFLYLTSLTDPVAMAAFPCFACLQSSWQGATPNSDIYNILSRHGFCQNWLHFSLSLSHLHNWALWFSPPRSLGGRQSCPFSFSPPPRAPTSIFTAVLTGSFLI